MSEEGEARNQKVTARSLIGVSLARLRRHPGMLLPFAVAGVISMVVDAIRFADPVPVQLQSWPHRGALHLTLLSFPSGSSLAGFTPGTVLGLKFVYLAELAGLGAVTIAAAAVATGLTVAENGALPWREIPTERFGRLFGYAITMSVVTTALVLVGSVHGLLALFAILFAFGVVARLFVSPAYIVLDGDEIGTAMRRSYAETGGVDLSIIVFLVVLGYASYALVSVPYVGTGLSTALVGTTYATATVVAYQH